MKQIKPKKPVEKRETIFEAEYRLKKEAKELSKKFKNLKNPKNENNRIK